MFDSSGDLHMITLTDMFGFECFHRNRTEQLMINSLNEQIQYHYNQRMFVWEMIEQVSVFISYAGYKRYRNTDIVYLFAKCINIISIETHVYSR